eukprot:NODE_3386_length_561_cov_729.753906_g2391_i1.p2 GENE.NODE_3386_length_561_cov_729.753906_g2391_i1~~NODE_3386_length_561_cov_729.753906_g2391_i1.p2  ORF type:complete len:79 (+),score=19.53 NODE_3386_length_561_cov_729.753906_g2391_i1:71-307(+)
MVKSEVPTPTRALPASLKDLHDKQQAKLKILKERASQGKNAPPVKSYKLKKRTTHDRINRRNQIKAHLRKTVTLGAEE